MKEYRTPSAHCIGSASELIKNQTPGEDDAIVGLPQTQLGLISMLEEQ
jgi:hypothetical protein